MLGVVDTGSPEDRVVQGWVRESRAAILWLLRTKTTCEEQGTSETFAIN